MSSAKRSTPQYWQVSRRSHAGASTNSSALEETKARAAAVENCPPCDHRMDTCPLSLDISYAVNRPYLEGLDHVASARKPVLEHGSHMASQPLCSCLVAPLEQSRTPLHVFVLGTLPPTVLLLFAFRRRSMKQRSLRRVTGTRTLANLGLDSSLQESIITVVDLSAAQPTLLGSRSFAHGTDPLHWHTLSETASRSPSSFLGPTSAQATARCARCKSSSSITGQDNIDAPGGSSGQPHKPSSSRASPAVEADDGSAALRHAGNTPSPLVSSGTSACRHGLIETDAEAWVRVLRKAFENILAPRVGASPIDSRPDYSVTSVQCKLSTRSASSCDTALPATASSGKKLINQLLCVVCAIVKLFVLACAQGVVLLASIALAHGLVACIIIILMAPRWNVSVSAHSSSPKHYVVPV